MTPTPNHPPPLPPHEETSRPVRTPLQRLRDLDALAAAIQPEVVRCRRLAQPMVVLCMALHGQQRLSPGAAAGTLAMEPCSSTLVEVAGQRLRHQVRSIDTVFQVGDAMFGLMLPGAAPNVALRVSDRLLRHFGAPYQLGTQAWRVEVSAGHANFPHDGDDARQLVRAACGDAKVTS